MATNGVKQRFPSTSVKPKPLISVEGKINVKEEHPAGPVKHGTYSQALRMVLFVVYFVGSCLCIFVTQLLGAPLYFYNKDFFYAWMAITKQHFGLIIITMTQWWSPTVVRVSGDKTVRGQLRKTEDGRLESDFPERIIVIANHQIYADWLYMWWFAYTARMHGHIYIILKESIKYIPIIGQGMMFFSFVLLSRKWAKDKPRFQHRLQKLNSKHGGFMSGSHLLDPMWLLIFPEGTNLSKNGRAGSKKWAEKTGIPDLRHALLPRSTGLQFTLQEMRKTVDWVYDCTLAYEGVPPGQFGQDIFTLRGTYFEGRPPKSVNMHWRRFAMSSIPIDDIKEFEDWLLQRWIEKDEILDQFVKTGRFPADSGEGIIAHGGGLIGHGKINTEGAGHIETSVKASNPLEILQMFVPLVTLFLIVNVFRKLYLMLF
ncbi:acyltransferase-domain-containing protein [Lepidopterella palustris CBS 459.81]|uniref:Acyltransferase-domain-containing protein n=1 Tax=Lepidopterella palustris CBS 459.81 TaxID=1314670 RepID=A0A8E2E4K5_9PEZI|nr:acyltransferase-domain-containing protein [Lepidopterella palustris CBS 459.81]